MTVKNLIKYLKKFDKNLPVVFCEGDGGPAYHTEINSMEVTERISWAQKTNEMVLELDGQFFKHKQFCGQGDGLSICSCKRKGQESK